MQARSSGNAQGVDVSRYQGTVEWDRVKEDGISFAFAKASEGASYRDPTFSRNVAGAKAAGVLIGAYHFLTARDEEAARKEAANFAGAISAAGSLDLPPVMDFETNPGRLTRQAINAVAKAFLTEIEALAGKKPILYTGNSFAQHFDASLGGYELWIARYSASSPPRSVAAWSRWTFWQYSDGSTGGTRPGGGRKVAGIAGAVDLNEYAGSEEELRAAYMELPKEDEPMTEAERKRFEAMEARLAELEKHLNISGKHMPPQWTTAASVAAKKAGIVTTVNDKGVPEFISLQMLYNAGLCNPELIRFFKSFSAETRRAIEELENGQ